MTIVTDMRIAAIDQGTTSTKALVLDSDGSFALVHAERHVQHHPTPDHVEHDPLELVGNIRHCLRAAGRVDAIGIDNQGESCLAWDAKTGRPLSPVIVWQDARTKDVISRLQAAGGEALTLARAGLPLDSYFSASKLRWLLDLPEVAAAHVEGRLRLGTTDAFFRRQLTGFDATDVTTASRTSLMNLASRQWDPELCALFDVPIETLPPILPTVGDLGLVDGTPLRCSVVDQQAALFGHGCRKPGDAKITFGTGAFALALTGDRIIKAPEHGLLPTVAWSTGEHVDYALDGGVYNAGSAIEWLLRIGMIADPGELADIDGQPAIARDLVFVPALSGLACPHWDRRAGALWLGMGLETERADLIRAVLEGIAFRAAEVIASIDQKITINHPISIDGGLSQCRYFVQFLANVMARPLNVAVCPELTALGCARMITDLTDDVTPAPLPSVDIQPVPIPEAWRSKFAEAVRRARTWQGPAPRASGGES